MLQGQKVEINTGADFDPIPMDKYTVQCTDVNLVKQQKYQSSEEEEVLNYQFAILDDKPMPADDEGKIASTRGRYLWKRCRLALNQRSWLGSLSKAAFGRILTKEEVAKFDPESIVGLQVDVMVEQKESQDGQKIFSNIVTFAKTTKQLKPMQPEEIKKKPGTVIEKTTVPAKAPDADNEADKLISDMKAEAEVKPATVAANGADAEAAAAEAEAAELEAKAAVAKAKAARARAAAQ